MHDWCGIDLINEVILIEVLLSEGFLKLLINPLQGKGGLFLEGARAADVQVCQGSHLGIEIGVPHYQLLIFELNVIITKLRPPLRLRPDPSQIQFILVLR